MISISDQIFLSNIFPLDSRISNIKLSSNNVIVETLPYYLARVDIGSRYLGMEVFILSPPGTYTVDDFLFYISNGDISSSKYKFVTVLDDGLVPVQDSITIVDNLHIGGHTDVLSAEQGKILKNLLDGHKDDVNNPHNVTKTQIGLGNVPNISFGGSNTGDETKTSIENKLNSASDINDGFLTKEDYIIFSNKSNGIQKGIRNTGSNSGYFGEIWADDDYMYICVLAGIAGIAKWKKLLLTTN